MLPGPREFGDQCLNPDDLSGGHMLGRVQCRCRESQVSWAELPQASPGSLKGLVRCAALAFPLHRDMG